MLIIAVNGESTEHDVNTVDDNAPTTAGMDSPYVGVGKIAFIWCLLLKFILKISYCILQHKHWYFNYLFKFNILFKEYALEIA